MALQRTGRDRIERGVSAREAFTHGNVSGRWYATGRDVPTGQMPDRTAIANGTVGAVFVVFSYRTPIAWYSPLNGWTQPATRYSVTTTNHQSVTAYAIARSAVTA